LSILDFFRIFFVARAKRHLCGDWIAETAREKMKRISRQAPEFLTTDFTDTTDKEALGIFISVKSVVARLG
jgi:hypothetical protein